MDFNKRISKIGQALQVLYERLNEMSGGVLEIIRSAIDRFSQERGSEAAASLAYYAFFSIFPMLLVIIVVGSFFVDRDVVQIQLLNLLEGILPGAEDIVIENIERVLQLRGAVTFIALISLTWSATSVFNIIAKNINRAFPSAQIPNFFKGRMLGFFMFLGLGLLMLLSFATSTVSGLIPVINIPFNDKALHETFLWQIGAFMVPIVTNILMFWAIYHWIPMVKVNRKASFLGAAIAGIAWELLNNAFTWYLSSGLSTYRLVYGSVGTIVALLFWIYLTAVIILIGANLTASIQIAIQKKPKVKVNEVFPRVTPVGESALLLELGESIDININRRILTLDQQLDQKRITGIIEWIPAYNSILILYDPAQTTESEVRLWLENCLNSQVKQTILETRTIEIPVKYGGKEGPDLDFVADFHGLNPKQVEEKHAAQVYRVAMMGFTPGFAYLMGLDPHLATPRLATPRTLVPAGSVGIAGEQTGIYPLDSPGGWQIIGKTEQSLFNPNQEPYFLLSPGDQVRFIPSDGGLVP